MHIFFLSLNDHNRSELKPFGKVFVLDLQTIYSIFNNIYNYSPIAVLRISISFSITTNFVPSNLFKKNINYVFCNSLKPS